jgi:ubiquitin-protein ligase
MRALIDPQYARAMKRAMADVAELQKPLYKETRIYYTPHDQSIQRGYACIFGPPETPYEDCPMFYEFIMGDTFPFDPPKVTFLTNDGRTRFHPNMYTEGKVCLSILGTWQGPKWASTMRLSTVLVTLQSLLDTQPLRHEPGYEVARNELCAAYANLIQSRCIQYTLSLLEKILDKAPLPDFCRPFQEELEAATLSILDRLQIRLQRLAEIDEKNYVNLPYSLDGPTQYPQLLSRVVKLKESANPPSQ